MVNNNAAAVFPPSPPWRQGGGWPSPGGSWWRSAGGFQVPDILARSGARLVEVGTTNKTRPADYAAALDAGEAQVLLRCTPATSGLWASPRRSPARAGALARKRGVPLFCDLGSAAPGSRSWRGRWRGPMCAASPGTSCWAAPGGILLGKAEPLGRLRADPLFRALRPGKLALAALEATLLDWRDGTAVPVSAMLSAPPGVGGRRRPWPKPSPPSTPARRWRLRGRWGRRPAGGEPARLGGGPGACGGAGSPPPRLAGAHPGPHPPGKLLLDVRTLLPGDEAEIAAALAAWREEGMTFCTAGHVDHGKTALVRALTGVDTDRLAEGAAGASPSSWGSPPGVAGSGSGLPGGRARPRPVHPHHALRLRRAGRRALHRGRRRGPHAPDGGAPGHSLPAGPGRGWSPSPGRIWPPRRQGGGGGAHPCPDGGHLPWKGPRIFVSAVTGEGLEALRAAPGGHGPAGAAPAGGRPGSTWIGSFPWTAAARWSPAPPAAPSAGGTGCNSIRESRPPGCGAFSATASRQERPPGCGRR